LPTSRGVDWYSYLLSPSDLCNQKLFASFSPMDRREPLLPVSVHFLGGYCRTCFRVPPPYSLALKLFFPASPLPTLLRTTLPFRLTRLVIIGSVLFLFFFSPDSRLRPPPSDHLRSPFPRPLATCFLGITQNSIFDPTHPSLNDAPSFFWKISLAQPRLQTISQVHLLLPPPLGVPPRS